MRWQNHRRQLGGRPYGVPSDESPENMRGSSASIKACTPTSLGNWSMDTLAPRGVHEMLVDAVARVDCHVEL